MRFEAKDHRVLHLITVNAAAQTVLREGEGRGVPLPMAACAVDPPCKARSVWTGTFLATPEDRVISVQLRFASLKGASFPR